ncbi:hypothetical protein FHS55_003959 [Angulomicrobium tetraedrale]|uniref:Uncharacterized protein n=1 Tax=Ancylobacter tetraedralis TaxID=217068 RepID=A0A839ZF99_9HYPH|nr:hypothetical protein [Ancylobacter tetraedralis]MBB3773326.1 hypothetical protein [Ancylobacter tetraedralis]
MAPKSSGNGGNSFVRCVFFTGFRCPQRLLRWHMALAEAILRAPAYTLNGKIRMGPKVGPQSTPKKKAIISNGLHGNLAGRE